MTRAEKLELLEYVIHIEQAAQELRRRLIDEEEESDAEPLITDKDV